MRFTCETIGQLQDAIAQWPREKPLIMDYDGNTTPVTIQDWTNEPPSSLEWPVVIYTDCKGVLHFSIF